MVRKKEQIRNIWMLSREYGSLAGAGGVKDVACQLAETLARWTGRSIHVVLPHYGFIDAKELGFQPVQDPLSLDSPLRVQVNMHLPDQLFSEEVRYSYKKLKGVHVYLAHALRFHDKSDVYTYTAADESRKSWQKKSMGHHDYFAMNVLHQKAALELMIALEERPDVIHCHDGHTSLLPALIRENSGYRSYFRATGCLVTIHNAGYGYHQEVEDLPYARSITELPEQLIDAHLLDAKFDPFLVAGSYALVNTVSENYARELQETDNDRLTGWLGHELKKRGTLLLGVTNGIDPTFFSPLLQGEGDAQKRFNPGDKEDQLAGKRYFKAEMLGQLAQGVQFDGLERYGTLRDQVDYPLFTFIGRFSEQKGIDLLLEVMGVLMAQVEEMQVLILGSGSSGLETQLIHQTENKQLKGRICFLKGFSPEIANRVFAAGDFFVVPSRYEPCGLTDFIAQLFGNIPVVHHVGGLVKVKDLVTGLAYRGDSPDGLLKALQRALQLYGDRDTKRRIQYQAVQEIEKKYVWSKVMKKYLDLYREAKESQTPQ